VDKLFDNLYSIEIPKLKFGEQELVWEINDDFFGHFEKPLVQVAVIRIAGTVTKYETHVDAIFRLTGSIQLECDRCTEEYMQPVNATRRVIFAYNENLRDDNEDVILVDPSEDVIHLAPEFYDFIHLEVPIRKVPESSVHECPPAILETLEKIKNTHEGEMDPRWEALRELKKKKQ